MLNDNDIDNDIEILLAPHCKSKYIMSVYLQCYILCYIEFESTKLRNF